MLSFLYKELFNMNNQTEIKKIIIDGEEIEIAVKLDKEYYEVNYNLENTLNLTKELENIVKDGDNNE